MGYSLVGRVWTVASFAPYLSKISTRWAKGVTIHHTGTPDLGQRPQGFVVRHMKNIAHFYKYKLRWSRGPHLFIDDDQIFGMSSLWERGVHARSFNSGYYGIEVLGNYDYDDPHSGRGKLCWDTAAKTTAIFLKKMSLPANGNTIKFHRDDPKTSKSCPGKLVYKDWFIEKVKVELKALSASSGDTLLSDSERLRLLEIEVQKLKVKIG